MRRGKERGERESELMIVLLRYYLILFFLYLNMYQVLCDVDKTKEEENLFAQF